MVFKQTTTLETALAVGARSARRHGGLLADRAFLWLLDRKDCHAIRLLGGFVRDWELLQIQTRIRLDAAMRRPAADDRNDPHALLEALARLQALYGAADGTAPLNTGHLLLYLLRSEAFVASRVLGMYAIPSGEVASLLRTLPDGEEELAPAEAEGTPPSSILPDEAETSRSPEEYTTDLTQASAEGRLDPLVGREHETERLIRILGRRKKNNPLLVGAAGVGKSALVEGLASRIAAGTVPPSLHGKRLLALDIAALMAGTKYRGEFERRMHTLLRWLDTHRDVILFIDEIHLIVGTGAIRQGGLDMANLLKPALVQGRFPCIGATTPEEYRQTIARDSALVRRFQPIAVHPPSPEETLAILRRLRPCYERHHRVRYTDDALQACIALAERYLPERNFPDKAIDLLDEAGSRAGGGTSDPPAEVTAETVRAVVGEITGVALREAADVTDPLLTLQHRLRNAVAGQELAVAETLRILRRLHTGLNDPDRPACVLLFAGPAATGKRWLAGELAEGLFGSREALTRIDMAAYTERSAVTGDGEGGWAHPFEALRQRPASVVVLQAIDKAPADFFPRLRQICAEGMLATEAGRIDFRSAVVILTLDLPADRTSERIGYRTGKATSPADAIRQRLAALPLPADLPEHTDGIVPFAPLTTDALRRLVRLAFEAVAERAAARDIRLELSRTACHLIAERIHNEPNGLLALRRLLIETVEEPLAALIADGHAAPGARLRIAAHGRRIVLRTAGGTTPPSAAPQTA